MNKFIVAAAAALLAAAFAVPTFAQSAPGDPGPNPPAATSPPAPVAPSTPLAPLH
jgi:hypothetical protein